MSTARRTKDHDDIREWAEARNGRPAVVAQTEDGGPESRGVLRIRFDDGEDDLDLISWEEFFETFDANELTFLYDPEKDSRFNKFISE